MTPPLVGPAGSDRWQKPHDEDSLAKRVMQQIPKGVASIGTKTRAASARPAGLDGIGPCLADSGCRKDVPDSSGPGGPPCLRFDPPRWLITCRTARRRPADRFSGTGGIPWRATASLPLCRSISETGSKPLFDRRPRGAVIQRISRELRAGTGGSRRFELATGAALAREWPAELRPAGLASPRGGPSQRRRIGSYRRQPGPNWSRRRGPVAHRHLVLRLVNKGGADPLVRAGRPRPALSLEQAGQGVGPRTWVVRPTM